MGIWTQMEKLRVTMYIFFNNHKIIVNKQNGVRFRVRREKPWMTPTFKYH